MAEPENGVSHRHSRKHGLGSYCKSLTCNSASSRPSPRSVDGNYKHARSTNLSSFPMVILILQHPDIYTKAAKIASKALQHVITDHTELFGGNGSRGTWGLLFRSFALLQKSKTSVSSRMEDCHYTCAFASLHSFNQILLSPATCITISLMLCKTSSSPFMSFLHWLPTTWAGGKTWWG